MEKSISLYYKEGSSNKEYHTQIVKSGDKFLVNFQYGRVGNTLKAGSKTLSPVSYDEAEKIYTNLVKEKMGKGYAEGEKKSGFSESNPNKPKKVILLPQLLNTIEDVESYINDDDYLAQEKMDGERRIVISDGRVIGLNKKGTEVSLPDEVIRTMKEVNGTFDGEIIGERLYVFDLLSKNGNDITDKPCIQRIAFLELLPLLTRGSGITIVKTAYTTKEKRKLFDSLKDDNKEGIVFKKKDGTYKAGRPNSGGNALKFKFNKTATFIVEGSTKDKRSVGLELIDGDKKVFMGKVTIPPNQEIPSTGDLVEVRYLYAYKGGAVFQPVYLGKRPDSDISDATMKQIVFKNEEV